MNNSLVNGLTTVPGVLEDEAIVSDVQRVSMQSQDMDEKNDPARSGKFMAYQSTNTRSGRKENRRSTGSRSGKERK